jgi:hypothetical protein
MRHSLSINDAKHGIHKITIKLVQEAKRSWLVFGRYPVTISSGTETTLTDVLRAFLSPSRRIPEKYLDYATITLPNPVKINHALATDATDSEILTMPSKRPQKPYTGFCSFIAKCHGDLRLRCRIILSEFAITVPKQRP